MARLNNGILGSINGNVGNVEGYHPIFNWDNRRARVMVLVHVEETGKSFYLFTGARITEETDFLEMPTEVKGLTP